MRRPDLLADPVGPTLLRLAGPMLIGITSILLFNVIDTMFVGQLGTEELAAMSFTFPVAFVVTSISMGLGIGTTSVISRAIGNGDQDAVKRLATHSLLLSNLVVAAVAVLGLVTVDPLFRLLGARPTLLPLIREYMVPWYLGIGLLVIPMVGNSAIRATGDTLSPSIIMVVAGVVNAIADPLLIFGLGPFPALGLQGAALATILSYGLAMLAAMYILAAREKMIEWKIPHRTVLLDSWRRILYIGLPAAATNVLVPISSAILTRLAAGFGDPAVAAYGVGGRLESLSMIGMMALGSSLAPFSGQNFGARRLDRLRQALSFATRATVLWGLGFALLSLLLRNPVAALFSDNPAVTDLIQLFLVVVPVSYAGLGMVIIAGSFFNAINHPLRSAFLITVRLFVLTIPLAYTAALFFDLRGLFGGVAVANLGAGLVAWIMLQAFKKQQLQPTTETAQ